MELSGQSHVPASLSPEGTPGEPQERRQPGPQRFSGSSGEDKYLFPSITDIFLRNRTNFHYQSSKIEFKFKFSLF
jgi:hypothetical protein